MEKPLTPTDVQLLRVKIEKIVQEKLESGEAHLVRFRDSEYDERGLCLLELVSKVSKKGGYYYSGAADILGLSDSSLLSLEAGFEGWDTLVDNSHPLYRLGAYFSKKYCEYED